MKQRNDYNAVVCPILTGGFRLPNSYSARSAHSTHSWHPFTPASQLTLTLTSLCLSVLRNRYPENARGQGHASPFHENYLLKKTQRYIDDERYFVYSSADTLGLLAPILHTYEFGYKPIHHSYKSEEIVFRRLN